jgi:hypothetical protein
MLRFAPVVAVITARFLAPTTHPQGPTNTDPAGAAQDTEYQIQGV